MISKKPETPPRGCGEIARCAAIWYNVAAVKSVILPSLLAADIGHLADEVHRAAASGADALHLDVMDANFVPNLSFGPAVVAMCRRVEPSFYRHVHLMMSRPDLYIERFVESGAQTVQIHVESRCDVRATLRRIAAAGARPAVVVNPETPASAALEYLDECSEVLVMSVHPGYGGQKFIEEVLPKIAELRKAAPGADIMVDGGVNAETLLAAARAGANAFVAGSYLFGKTDMREAVAGMRSAIGKEIAA